VPVLIKFVMFSARHSKTTVVFLCQLLSIFFPSDITIEILQKKAKYCDVISYGI